MSIAPGDEHAAVVAQRAAGAKVYVLAVEVRDPAAELGEDELGARVVPDVRLGGGADGDADVDVAAAEDHGGVAHVRGPDVGAGVGGANVPGQAGDDVVPGRLAAEGVDEVHVLEVLGSDEVCQALRFGGGEGGRWHGEAADGGALAADGRHHDAQTGGVDAGLGDAAGGGEEEVGAAQDADDLAAVLDEGEGDGVLLALEEGGGAVDGVHDPEAAPGAALAGPAHVDEPQHLLDVFYGGGRTATVIIAVAVAGCAGGGGGGG